MTMVTGMMKKKHNHGFSLTEMLIALGILAALCGIAFLGIVNHLRDMTKLEYDGYAKEIFVAAQNHLTMAEHLGYLGLTAENSGTAETKSGSDPDGIYYILVKNGNTSASGALDLMLPSGALADGKTLSGSYIIRYHRASARVLDVFFWEEHARFKHTYKKGDYAGFLNAVPDGLKDYSDEHSVIGYYGGATAGISYQNDVRTPSVRVENGDVLCAIVTYPTNDANIKVPHMAMQSEHQPASAARAIRIP